MGKGRIKVLHLAEGEKWGGIEAHLLSLLPGLHYCKEIETECILFHEGLLADRLRDEGIKTEILNRKHKYDFSVPFKLARTFCDRKIDVLHFHGYRSVIYGIIAAWIGGKKRIAITLHAAPNPVPIASEASKFRCLKLKFYLWLAYRLIKVSAAQLIAVSQDVHRKHIEEKNLGHKIIKVIYNGYSKKENDEQLSGINKRNLKIPANGILVGMVGRLDENKGHIFLLQAAENILAIRKDIFYVIIGSGPAEESLKKICVEKSIHEHVTFLGFLENPNEYFEILDMLVIASMHEGIPYSMLEAMARGIPVIATNVGGMPEVIRDGINGILIPSRNDEAIQDAILRLAGDPSLRRVLSQKAEEILKGRFSREAMVEETISFYRSMKEFDLPCGRWEFQKSGKGI